MKKVQNKYDNFSKALKRLNEVMTIAKSEPDNDIYRDSLIKRYEFTFELAWNTVKAFMLDQHIISDSFNAPRNILKKAYAEYIIDNEEVWVDMLEARNKMTHLYDEKEAAIIAENILLRYGKQLNLLADFLKKNT